MNRTSLTHETPKVHAPIPLPALNRRSSQPFGIVRVLVLDDNEDDFTFVQILLEKSVTCTYDIVWAPNEMAGLKALKTGDFDVGLFDYKLGGTTGLEILCTLQSQNCKMPVILLTGSENPDIDQAALDAGAADYLCKGSLDTTRLERAIRYSISHAQMLSALRESQAQLQLFMRSVPCAVCIYDETAVPLYENEIFKRHFSVDLIRSLKKTSSTPATPSHYSNDGRHWLVTNFPMVENSGRNLQGIAAIDITSRVEAENELRKTSALLNGVLASLPMIVGRLDGSGVIVEAEGQKLEKYGMTPASMVGQPLAQLHPQLKPAVAEALKGGNAHSVLTGRHGNGEWHADFFLFFDRASGRGALFFGCDITQRKLIERELLRVSDAEKNRIGSDLHDGLGQYLTGISCLSVALRDKLQDRDRAEAEEAATISTLVQEAIAQTRALARGLCPVQLETSGLETALEDLTYQVQRLHGIECSFHPSGPIDRCEATHALHLYRIAQEAINNAVKHASARRIRVTLDFSKESKVLAIEDDGCGFDPDFEHGPSTGLRLMPYRAAMIGGTLTVTSKPNHGTQVECRFVHPH